MAFSSVSKDGLTTRNGTLLDVDEEVLDSVGEGPLLVFFLGVDGVEPLIWIEESRLGSASAGEPTGGRDFFLMTNGAVFRGKGRPFFPTPGDRGVSVTFGLSGAGSMGGDACSGCGGVPNGLTRGLMDGLAMLGEVTVGGASKYPLEKFAMRFGVDPLASIGDTEDPLPVTWCVFPPYGPFRGDRGANVVFVVE